MNHSLHDRAIEKEASLKAWCEASELLNAGDIDNAELLLKEWIEKDQLRGDYAAGAAKYEIYAQVMIRRSQSHKDDKVIHNCLQEAADHLAKAAELTMSIGGYEGARRRGGIWQIYGHIMTLLSDNNGTITAWKNALSEYESVGLEHEIANCNYLIGVLKLNYLTRHDTTSFLESKNSFLAALKYYDANDVRISSANTVMMLGRLMKNRAVLIAESDPAESSRLISESLSNLARAEQLYDDIRHEYRFNEALKGQIGRQSLITNSRQIFEDALSILTTVNPDFVETWRWVQRAKARSLTDMLAESNPPKGIVAALQLNPVSKLLLDDEITTSSKISEAKPNERLELRRSLKELHDRMEKDQIFNDYLEFRQGRPIEVQDLEQILKQTKNADSVLFVDWFTSQNQIWVTTLKQGNGPITTPVGMEVDKLSKFVATNLSSAMFRSTLIDLPEIMRELDKLISPIAELCNPEDIVVLSPTGLMNLIPLHALEIDGQPLLCRNPVVYTPSMNILRYCFERNLGEHSFRSAAVFGDPEEDRKIAGSTSEWVADYFNTFSYTGEKVLRKVFYSELEKNDLIHFQGHAEQVSDDPLSSHLRLHGGDKLTARNIFEHGNIKARLVTLAACESGVSKISAGDEPYGLIPAFLYAGAGAVLASLWKVNESSSAMFVRQFYSYLNDKETIIDKARACRQASLDVRAASRSWEAPYHWAPFILCGDWR